LQRIAREKPRASSGEPTAQRESGEKCGQHSGGRERGNAKYESEFANPHDLICQSAESGNEKDNVQQRDPQTGMLFGLNHSTSARAKIKTDTILP